MRNILKAELIKVPPQKACLGTLRSVACSVIIGGVFLSFSQNGIALPNKQEIILQQAKIKPGIGSTLDKRSPVNSPIQNQLKGGFLKNIRSAIAAKWKTSQLHNFIELITNPPSSSTENANSPYYNQNKDRNSFEPILGHSTIYDNNLLRISNASNNDLTDRSKGDLIKQIRAGIAAKWHFKKQVLLVKAIISQNWYETYNELNYLGRDIQAQWNWQIGKYLTGQIGYTNKVSMGNFGQLNQLSNNLLTQTIYLINGQYQFLPNWFLKGELRDQSLGFSGGILQPNNINEKTAQLGLKYQTPNKNAASVNYAITDGKYPLREIDISTLNDNAYVQHNFNIEWSWQHSVKTNLKGQVGYIVQKYQNIASRNFSEPAANLQVNWDISDKTALTLSAWREPRMANTINANFVVSQGIKINPSWLMTPKFSLSLPVSYEQQNYLGNPGLITSTIATEHDEIFMSGLIADYNPFRNTTLSLYWGFEKRTSTELLRNYQSNLFGLDIDLKF